MTQLTFNDDTKNHSFPPEITNFWNHLINSVNPRNYETFRTWPDILKYTNIHQLFEYIIRTFNFEKNNQANNLTPTEQDFNSIKILDLLLKILEIFSYLMMIILMVLQELILI